MSWSKALDEKEVAFIEKSFPRLSCAEIARKLGRSTRCVQKAVNRLGLRERRAPAPRVEEGRDDPSPPAGAAGEGGAQDELAELRDLKRILKRTLRDDIDPRSMPKLSAEYREVIKRIGELEGGGDGGSGGALGGAGAESLLVSIPLRPS